jgi:hypothetical protein
MPVLNWTGKAAVVKHRPSSIKGTEGIKRT